MTTSKVLKWIKNEFIYHIYPLGMLGADPKNSFNGHVINRLPELMNWADYFYNLGVTAIYIGPLFSSSSHGYDTADYFCVDQRLGTNADLKALVEYYHQHDIKIIVDAVFNHCGREFFAFKDVLFNRHGSRYSGWISGLNFHGNTHFNDGFSYDSWNGHHSLVKLNQSNPEVIGYFREVIEFWITEFNIDGLRFDAADVMDRHFLSELTRHARSLKSGFWTIGEVIHGDYNSWLNEGGLDSVTNYEAYKSLYSSLNDKNYFELSWTLNRQFGSEGLYRDVPLYNFCDNHDVNRIGSQLKDNPDIFPLHIALFTMPGIPVIYYGSENGINGKRNEHSDHQLRPRYTVEQAFQPNNLRDTVIKLNKIRKENPALSCGDYRQEAVSHQQLAFSRDGGKHKLLIVLNSDKKEAEIAVPWIHGCFYDILNDEWCTYSGRVKVYPKWGRILKVM